MRRIEQIMIVLILFASNFIGFLNILPSVESQYTPHDPILIEGDDDFAAQAASEGWPGDGTEGNPYIIEGYEINASDGNGVEIWNTSINFIIKESFIRGERGSSEGIYLYNVTNGTINDCVIENTRIGLELILSSANRITENTITQNYWRGILLTNSDDNIIAHNNITKTEWRSIYLDYSDDNKINNNSISQDSSHNAINLYYSRRNIVKNNTMIACGLFIEGSEIDDWVSQDIDNSNTIDGKPIYYLKNQAGEVIPMNAGQIILVNSSELKIENQDFEEAYIGIQLVYSSNNIILKNNVTSNEYGIYLFHSNENTIANNIASDDGYGVYLDSSNNNVIVNNTVSNNAFGIYISENSNLNEITANLMNSNYYSGISLFYSNGTTIKNNVMIHCNIVIDGSEVDHWLSHNIDVSNTIDGKSVYFLKDQTGGSVPLEAGQIILVNCTNMTVKNHKFLYNNIGIMLAFSSRNNIINNTVTQNSYGIYLQYSNHNFIKNNKLYTNWYGIHLYHSDSNDIINNSVLYNDNGIYLLVSNNNNISNNTALDNGGGINLQHSGGNNLIFNNLSFNEKGAELYYSNGNEITSNHVLSNSMWGIFLLNSSYCVITNNNITKNNFGLDIDRSFGNNIINNSIYSSTHEGIALRFSDCNKICSNKIIDNWRGLSLRSSQSNIIYYNFLINDSNQDRYYFDHNIWNNSEGEGNYWSDYDGIDEDGDGVGDTKIPHRGVDYFPLTDNVKIIPSNSQVSDNWKTEFIFLLAIFFVLILIILVRRRKKRPIDINNESHQNSQNQPKF